MKRGFLILFLFLLLAACATLPAPAPTVVTGTPVAKTPEPVAPAEPSPSPTPQAAEPTAVPTLSADEIKGIFAASPDFSAELFKQDRSATKDFLKIDDQLFVVTADGARYEVDTATAAVGLDINSNQLQVQDAAFSNPLTIHGTGESEGKTFAFTPEARVHVDSNTTHDKIIPAHWFEVIKSNHPVDMKASQEAIKAQLEASISDPVKATVDQVQSGELAMSVLLSGLAQPFPKDWKFTGNAINHNSNDPDGGDLTLLYSSKELPIPFFLTVVDDGGQVISGIIPYQVGNPEDTTKPNKNEVMFINVGIGKENFKDKTSIQNLIEAIFIEKYDPTLIILSNDKFPSSGSGILVRQPSILALKNIPGNDPRFIKYFTDPKTGTTNIINDIIGYYDNNSGDIWQFDFSVPLPSDFQNLIWFVYYS